MTKLAIVEKASGAIHKFGFQIKKHSPEILLVAGVVGTVTSAVMACKATTKISTILEDTKETIDKFHQYAEYETKEDYTVEDSKKDLAITYVQTGVKLAKLYAPSVILGALSITSILASNDILRKRNVAIAAAYATLDRGFKEYRSNVVERYGEEVDRELKYNIKAKKFEEKVVDEKTGKEKTVKTTVKVADVDGYSGYARFFDEGCRAWEKDSETNLFFLRAEQNYANDRLRSRGYLFLNEVYERLGIPTTKAGQSVGWIYNPNDPEHKGDNYVDFGIYDMHREKCRDFVNGYERVILLDFNVDGDITNDFEYFMHN